MSRKKLAQHVQVERHGDVFRLMIDGVEFPYLLALEPIEVRPIHPEEVPGVRFTLLAARVDATNSDNAWELTDSTAAPTESRPGYQEERRP